jgi:TonB family protein
MMRTAAKTLAITALVMGCAGTAPIVTDPQLSADYWTRSSGAGPEYPDTAQRHGIEGFVRISVLIGSDGKVSNPAVVESKPPKIFDEAALAAASQWRFEPTESNPERQPVIWATILRFELEDLPESERPTISADPAERLLQLAGLTQHLAEVKEKSEKLLHAQMEMTIQQLLQAFPDQEAEISSLLDRLQKEYIEALSDAWTVEEAASIYAAVLSTRLDQRDIESIAAGLESPDAQREVAAYTEAARAVDSYLSERMSIAAAKASQEFIAELQAWAKTRSGE